VVGGLIEQQQISPACDKDRERESALLTVLSMRTGRVRSRGCSSPRAASGTGLPGSAAAYTSVGVRSGLTKTTSWGSRPIRRAETCTSPDAGGSLPDTS